MVTGTLDHPGLKDGEGVVTVQGSGGRSIEWGGKRVERIDDGVLLTLLREREL